MLLKISASAGSGKTYTLTREFHNRLKGASFGPPLSGCALHAAKQVYTLDEILAATFTNKAAAEMKTRILTTLKEEALEQQKTLNHQGKHVRNDQHLLLSGTRSFNANKWVNHILRHYGSLQVRTIDSLLTTLVRLSVLDLGLPLDFTPSFSRAEYFVPVYESLIEDLSSRGEEKNNNVYLVHSRRTLIHALEEACLTLILTSGKKGFTVKDSLQTTLCELVDMQLKGETVPDMASADIRNIIASLQESIHAVTKLILTGITKEKLNAAKNFIHYLHKLLEWHGVTDLPDSNTYAFKNTLDECLNKASQGVASNELYKLYQTFSNTCKAVLRLYPLLKSALRLAPLTLLATELTKRIRKEQQEKKLVPAISLPLFAKQVLHEEHGASNALCRLGTRLSHILLDEFQDTSKEQWASLLPLVEEGLAKGGSFTYVGDTKQAIYSWRGGEASLFESVLQTPKLLAIAPSPQSHTLPYNWRSSPHIIQHNNIFFSLIAQKEIAEQTLSAMLPSHTPHEFIADAVSLAIQTFSDSTQGVPPDKTYGETKGKVRLYEVEAPTVQEVESLLETRLQRLFLDELSLRWQFRDVAVLVRSASEAKTIASFLAKWHIPFVTENSFLLADQPIIRRITAFLTFLDYPLDDLAFWEFISGKECFGKVMKMDPELSFEALHTWIAQKSLTQKRLPLYVLFKERFPWAWDTWIAPFFSQAGLMSAYDTLLEIIKHFGLHARLPEQDAFLQRFSELAYLAETQGHSSLAAFLHFWQRVQQDEKIPLPESMDAVRIMTMHKAKGLEFPVVVLPFHHTAKPYEAKLHTFQYERKELIAKAGKELPQAFYRLCVTEALESLHLLYVAWTRPVYELHAFITRPDSSKNRSPLLQALQVLLEEYKKVAAGCYEGEKITFDETEDYTEGLIAKERKTVQNAEASLDSSTFLDEPQKNGGHPDALAPPSLTATPNSSQENLRPMSWLPRLKIFRSVLHDVELTADRRGTLAHLCLEHLVYSHASLTAHDTMREKLIEKDVFRAVQHALRLFPLPLENPGVIAEEMVACLLWFATQQFAPKWLTAGTRERSLLNEKGELFRVDLLVDEKEKGLRAVDYKTGLPSELHKIQVYNYLDLLSKAQDRPVHGSLVYLDEQMIQEVLL